MRVMWIEAGKLQYDVEKYAAVAGYLEGVTSAFNSVGRKNLRICCSIWASDVTVYLDVQ